MTTTVILPMAPYPAGTYTMPSTAVPLNISTVKVAVDRTLWADPAVTVDARMEWSFDGGTVWSPGGGWTANGGTMFLRDGTTVSTESFASFVMPQASNPNRKIRGSVVVAGGTVTSSVSLTTS